ncbi:MAG: ferrous iron transport protein B [Magnetococcales bacterium]|nr:ferrous iron transport protein B [Magnetococcales bacterium]
MSEGCHPADKQEQATDPKGGRVLTVAVVGLSNTGKSALFNALTNAYAIVANYAQTTVSIDRKRAILAGKPVELLDTPGVTSLIAFSADQERTVRALVTEPPDRILFCADATRLKQSLVLFAQIMELGVPTLFCLNKVDEAGRNGTVVDADQLARSTGVPVIEMAIAKGIGVAETITALDHPVVSQKQIALPEILETGCRELESLFPWKKRPARALLLQYLLGNAVVQGHIASHWWEAAGEGALKAVVQRLEERHEINKLRTLAFNAWESWADAVCDSAQSRTRLPLRRTSQRLAHYSRHPLWGWPIFLAVLWVIFKGVGVVAPAMANTLDGWIFTPLTDQIGKMVGHPFLHELLVGPYGLLTMGAFNALMTVVPILLIFFFILNLLEDIGYLPQLSVLANRSLRPFGLSGKSVLPLVLGAGCNTMATMTCRTLETRKERLVTTFMIALGMPCAVQMGIIFAVLAVAPFWSLLIFLAAVGGTTILCGYLLNRLVKTGRKVEFILELPPFQWPNWRNTFRKTYYRIKWFLLEALPLFIVAAGLMFTLEKTGLLEGIKWLLRPITTGFLALPDRVTEAFIMILSRREVGVIYFKTIAESGGLSDIQIIVGLVVITLFIPCISNTVMMVKEVGLRWAAAMNLAIIVIAFLVGGATNAILHALRIG